MLPMVVISKSQPPHYRKAALLDTSSTQQAGDVDITVSGQLSLAGQIDASSSDAAGGDVTITANQIIENQTNVIDASGDSQGGVISVEAQTGFISSGRYDASSANGRGGQADLTATDLRLLGAQIDANGEQQGGIVRLGGAFQGGKTPDITQDYYDSFVGRWPNLPAIENAGLTFVNDSTNIIVSSSEGTGGTAIIWSDDQTTFRSIKHLGYQAGLSNYHQLPHYDMPISQEDCSRWLFIIGSQKYHHNKH